jgi:hypothetical protein
VTRFYAPQDGRGFRDFYHNWTNSILQQLKRKFWKIVDELKFFRVPEARVQSIYCKLAMRVFDVYVNILKDMYSTRFSGGSTMSEASSDAQPTPIVATSLPRTIDTLPKTDKFKRRKKESQEAKDKQDNKIDSI